MGAPIVLSFRGTYGLKPWFQGVLRPLVRKLARAGVRANHVTVAAATLSVACGVSLLLLDATRGFVLLPGVWLARMALNAIDGMLAREFGQASRLGLYLNELGDVVSDVFLMLPFAHVAGFSPFWVWTVAVGAVLTEFAGVLGVMAGEGRRYDGPMGKSDRAFVFGALGLWVGLAGGVPPAVASVLPPVLVGLLAVTVIQRVRSTGFHLWSGTGLQPVPPRRPIMRHNEEHEFLTLDGTRIFYRRWPALEGAGDRAVILLHRGHEHSGRLQFLAEELALPECSIFAWDARGHGRSPGRRGHAPSFGTLVKDLDTFARHVAERHGIAMENIAVIGQSVGAVLAAAWAHDYAPKLRALVLAAPAFRIKLYVPFARPALALASRLIPSLTVKSYVKARFLTHDADRARDYETDPLITRDISARVLLDVYYTAARMIADAPAIHTPTQVLLSGSDFVVHRKPQIEFFRRLGSRVKELHELPGFYHDTLGEKDRHIAIGKARAFLLRCFSLPAGHPSLAAADAAGPTREEFDRLNRPLPALAPKAVAFAAVRAAMATGGRLSDGIRVGLETGFDSGSSLDYVYRNRAAGITPIGKLTDWMYINSLGWRGIRVRKRHLEWMLVRAMAELRARGLPVSIVDIAAGHGRYVLDSVGPHAASVDRILLRDRCGVNVERGSALIAERGLEQVARFEQGDAFDRASLAAMEPRPTLAVVSGLYELFPENAPLRESLGGLGEAVRPRGYIVYTGQPWHPQLEFIARTLRSHRDGRPWVMRRRSQAELDQLVEAAGFRKVDQLTDDWGIFTVSLAQKVAA